MDHFFDIIKTTRTNFLDLMAGLSVEEINSIPVGFNNNIIWNLGHIVATQQILCYHFSNLDMRLDQSFVEQYKKGTRPEAPVTGEEWEKLKNWSLLKVDNLKTDFTAGIFQAYQPYTTSYGVSLSNITEAIHFSAVHEGLHYGYALALKRAIKLS